MACGRYPPRAVFADLLSHPGVEEHVVFGSPVGFLALHGGLEPGTAEVARAAATTSGASLYTVVQPGDLHWHVPAHQVAAADAPSLAAFLTHVDVVVSLHGYLRAELPMAVLVGGTNRRLARRLGTALRASLPDYDVVDDLSAIPPDLRGVHPANPVNLTRGGGIQLELPHPVRAIGPFRNADYERHTDALVAVLAGFAAAHAA
jgi:phage replication-related protein YjqB (UPF0714/DUF867 family)